MRRLLCLTVIAVAACGGDDKKSDQQQQQQEPPPAPTPISVTGRVVDGMSISVPNATVQVLAAGATTSVNAVTDATGHFSVDNILTPYDVTVTTVLATYLFVGVSRADPTLVQVSTIGPSPSGAEVSGAVGPDPAPADKAKTDNVIIVDCSDAAAIIDVPGTHDDYDDNLGGFVTEGETCTFSALRYNTDTDVPTTFGSFTTQASIHADDITGVDISPIAAETVTTEPLHVTLAAGVELSAIALIFVGTQHHATSLLKEVHAPLAPNFTVAVPGTAKLSLLVAGTVTAQGTLVVSTVLLDPSAASVEVSLNPGVSVIAPTVAAASSFNADTGELTVAGGSTPAYLHTVTPTSGTTTYVITTDTTLSAATLSAHGLPLAHNADYMWIAQAYDGVTSMDDFTSGRITYLNNLGTPGSGSETNQLAIHTAP